MDNLRNRLSLTLATVARHLLSWSLRLREADDRTDSLRAGSNPDPPTSSTTNAILTIVNNCPVCYMSSFNDEPLIHDWQCPVGNKEPSTPDPGRMSDTIKERYENK